MFGGDNEIGNLLQEAVKLKTAQMNDKRRAYEKWPFFVQHTLFHSEKDEFKAWRKLPFDERLTVAEGIKEEGNKLYASGSWADAVEKYEEAGSLFHYCYSTDPGWRKNNRGIDDDVLILVDDVGSTPEEGAQQRRFRTTCALNLAACKQKMDKHDEAIVACNVALELDPTNVKGLFRRAEARVRPSKSTAYDLDLAIKDLAKANDLDPKNQPVEKLLSRLRKERREQREKDQKTFDGMFGRGEIYNGDAQGREGSSARVATPGELDVATIQSRLDSIDDSNTLERRLADAELLRDLYMRNGKEEEAKELNEKIEAGKRAMRAQQEPEPQRAAPDWANPTAEMIEDAKKHGLDLTDPMIIAELKRLEREGLDKLGAEGDEDGQAGGASDSQASAASLHLPPMPDGEPVEWLRYLGLIAGIFAIWQLVFSGIVGWVVRSALSLVGLGGSAVVDDAELAFSEVKKSNSLLSMLWNKAAGLLGGSSDGAEAQLEEEL